MSPLTKNPYTFHRYPNSANRNIKKAIKAIKILTFYQQRRTPWYHVCEKQQRANSGQGWHFCHAQWTSNGYSYFRSSFTTSAFLYLKLPILQRKRKRARFTCFSREDSQKYLNERIFARDSFAWSVIYPKKGKYSPEREHPLSTLRSFRFHAGNSLS